MNTEIIVDRAGDPSDPDYAIFVIFPDGEKIRFWLTGLTDEEYIARAEAIRSDTSFNDYLKNIKKET